ncbi:MAG: translesion DNA synthesis-associated protein ImuA [Gammaproteobacteria bacterium]|nr:translesion DNA synthesis-associated protein ImuA [Gammaproteobacteria bacterium]
MDLQDRIDAHVLGPHVWRGKSVRAAHAVVSTGFAALDRKLSGGWPWGAMIEIFVERYGIGELTLLMPTLASLSTDQKAGSGWIVWVAPPWVPYAPALARCGVDPGRILLVHPSAGDRKAVLWTVEQALRSGASVAVLAWLESAADAELRRLQLAAEEQRCGLVLFRPSAALRQRSPAALRLKLSGSGEGTRVGILKCRGARPAQLSLELSRGGTRGQAPAGDGGCR